MARQRWRDDVMDPFRELDRLREEINRLFEPERVPMVRGLFDRPVAPPVDVLEDAERYRVICDVPGMKREEIEITCANGVLTIKGEKRPPKQGDQTRSYRQETWYGRFQRTVALSVDVDVSRITADLADGVLSVDLPKSEHARPRQIAIQAR